jgi:hypothetical protein
MHSLALVLIENPELAKSAKEPRLLLEAASHAGFWKSSVVLGVLERDGRDTSPNVEAAYYYFQVALLQGGKKAAGVLANDLSAASTRLTAEKMAAITSKANAWFQENHLTLAFVYKDGENRKQFPASALLDAEEGVHAGKLVPPPPA